MSFSSKIRKPSGGARVRRGLSFLLSLSLLLAVSVLPLARTATTHAAPAAPVQTKTSVKHPLGEYVPGEVLVRFRDEATATAVAGGKSTGDTVLPLRVESGAFDVQIERFAGSEIVEGLRLARVPAEETIAAVEALNARPDVLYAEPNYIWRKTATPNDPRFPEQYALSRISAPQAWDITQGSSDVVVGVIDGGVDVNHPDLQPNIWVNPGDSTVNNIDDDGNGFRDDVNGWDFFHSDRTVFDNEEGDDHATHVAGTIGARGNNGVGVTGVNWQVKIMSLKVLGPEGGGSTTGIVASYNYARMMKQRGVNIRVLNNSYGGPGFSQSASDAIAQLNAVGILFVAAAGNDSLDNFGFPHFPSNYDLPNVIAVASTNTGDGLSSFSNFGARVVSMGAPGSSILSTTPNNTYSIFGGTSMAAPHVAGGAALVLAANPNLTMQQLRGVIAYSGDVLPSLLTRTTTGRRLNVFAAINSAREAGGGVDTTAPAAAGNLQITSQSGRNATLSWNAPGDDGDSGTAADYDFFFVNGSTGLRTLLPTTLQPAAAGTQQSATVALPYRNFSGTIELRTTDNAGNTSTTSVPVSVAVNQGSDPYIVSQGASGGLSTGGELLAINEDDAYRDYFLPFGLPFFGSPRGQQVTLSSNGAIYIPPFSSPSIPPRRDDGSAGDLPSSIAGLGGTSMIAGLWDDIDLRTCFRADAGIYVVKPDAATVIFRWQGVPFTSVNCPVSPSSNHINFEIELKSNGTITTRYGNGNNNLHPVVGISAGEPDPYVVGSHTSEFPGPSKSLTNAPSVIFTPRVDAAPCTYNVAFNTTSFPGTGGTGTVNIGTRNDCNWNVTTNVPWITLTPPTSGSGNGAVSFSLAPNTGNPTPRFGNITVAGTAYTISQGAGVSTTPAKMQFNGSAYAVSESAGSTQITVSRTENTEVATSIDYLITAGSAIAGADFIAGSGTVLFGVGETIKSFTVSVLDDPLVEQPESVILTLTNPNGNGTLGSLSTAVLTITSDDVAVPNETQFEASAVSVAEDGGRVQLNVTRTGNTTQPVTVSYMTGNLTASDRSDYSISIGTLRFAANQTSKTIEVFVNDDAFDEPDETFGVQLISPFNTTLGATQSMVVTITDNDAVTAATNPIDDSAFFVRQHYVDFFNREPDAAGLAFWTNQIEECGANVGCREVRRINVSAAFFVSTEFQETGYLVYRTYHVAFLTGHSLGYRQFLADTQEIGRGVIVNQGDWQAQLEANKQAFFNEFVTRPEFVAAFPYTMTNTAFVNKLHQNAGLTLSDAQISSFIAGLNNSTMTRASVLRATAENQTLMRNEYRRAFVLMQYFGYLRRAPNESPNTDFSGYHFWLNKLNEFGGNYVTSELVKAFITSGEYRQRFGN